ncbi:unnamed protein product [Cuscuta europaea]|uniref:Uncharacterized protein n=1 Tax=Cuscuta europaea TaxID=41803 RepID=A0A9P1E7E1_CUSEU|nr:unnamed protein product [Cuscuta europaea]
MASVQEEHALRQAALACEEGIGQNQQTLVQKRKKAAPSGSSMAKKKKVINKGKQVQLMPDSDEDTITRLMQLHSKLDKQKELSMQLQEIRSKTRHEFQGSFVEDTLGIELLQKEVERMLKKEKAKGFATEKTRSGPVEGSKGARGSRSGVQESSERRRSGRLNKEREVCNEKHKDVVVPDTEEGSEEDLNEREEAVSDEDFVNLPKEVVKNDRACEGRQKRRRGRLF